MSLNFSFSLPIVIVSLISLPLSAQVADRAAPVTLGAVLARVSATHPAIGAASANILAARGDRSTAGAFSNPVLTYQLEKAPRPVGHAATMGSESMITLMIPLEPLYQRGARMRRADAAVRAVEADTRTTRQAVAIDAGHVFYRTALAQVSAESTRDLATWLDSVVAYNKSRAEEGAIAEVDLLRAQLERDRVLSELTLLEADLARARADLAVLLGNETARLTDIVVAVDATALPLRAPADASLSALSSNALQARPEMLAARERLNSLNAQVSVERSLFIRELGAVVGAKKTEGPASFVGGVSIPLPLFDQNRGQVNRAMAERAMMTFELTQQERVVRAEVSGAWEAARLLSDRITALTAAPTSYLARADEARRISFGAYREGAVPLTQVIDAARAWSESRISFFGVLFAQHEAVLALHAAQGSDVTSALEAIR